MPLRKLVLVLAAWLLLATAASAQTALTFSGAPNTASSVVLTWATMHGPNGEAATTSDWIGLYQPGHPSSNADGSNAASAWVRTSSCTQTNGAVVLASGSCTMSVPGTSTAWEFRLFWYQTYDLMATVGPYTDPLTVATATATSTPTPAGPTATPTSSATPGGPTLTPTSTAAPVPASGLFFSQTLTAAQPTVRIPLPRLPVRITLAGRTDYAAINDSGSNAAAFRIRFNDDANAVYTWITNVADGRGGSGSTATLYAAHGGGDEPAALIGWLPGANVSAGAIGTYGLYLDSPFGARYEGGLTLDITRQMTFSGYAQRYLEGGSGIAPATTVATLVMDAGNFAAGTQVQAWTL